MKVIVDHALNLRLFGQQTPRPDSPRFYYQAVGYDCLVICFHDDDYVAWRGREGVALFNFDQVDGRTISQIFPKAPARWAREQHLIQVTVRRVAKPPRGRPRHLSQAVREMIGDEC